MKWNEVQNKVREQLETVLRKYRGPGQSAVYVTKYVTTAEVMDINSRKQIIVVSSPDLMMWELQGLLEYTRSDYLPLVAEASISVRSAIIPDDSDE